jgi:uncharacterized membrane protein YphA (DoxX/SURF4 family)
MDTLRNRGANYFISAALSIPFFYHGFWNLSADGEKWWASSSHFPAQLRVVVGVVELFAAVGVWWSPFKKLAAAIIGLIMVGAIFEHYPAGFSFKQNGYETPLVYFLIAASLLCQKTETSVVGTS